MSFSFIALNRVVENRAAEDADYRAELQRNGKVLLSEARALSDAALLAKLAGFGIALDRDSLRKLAGEFLSAEGIYREVMKDYRPKAGQRGMGEDWVQDVEMALANAAVDRPEYHRHRIRFCEEFLQRFGGDDPLVTENMRRALAESVWGSGERECAEGLFEAWLKDDPQWGWGWIGWSDLHGFPLDDTKPDWLKAEAILQRGLAVASVRHREHLKERLAEIYEQTGRTKETATLRKPTAKARTTAEVVDEDLLRLRTTFDFGEEGLPLDELPKLAAAMRSQHLDLIQPPPKRKVGRNEPCPCGSGRKFKQCCGG